MNLSGAFSVARRETFDTLTAVTAAVEAHAAGAGFTKVKIVEDADDIRFTATTPAGRAGHNVAYVDEDFYDGDY